MERYKSLYKENLSALSPRKQNRHVVHAANRSKRRIEMYCSARDFEDTSPRTKSPVEACSEHKPVKVAENNENKKSAGLSSRTLNYLRRYKAWKEQKEEEKRKRPKVLRPPFIPVGTSNNLQMANTSSFAPANHKFKPPKGLKKPTIDKTENFKIPKSRMPKTKTPTDNMPSMSAPKKARITKPLVERFGNKIHPVKSLPPKATNVKTEKAQFPIARKAIASVQPPPKHAVVPRTVQPQPIHLAALTTVSTTKFNSAVSGNNKTTNVNKGVVGKTKKPLPQKSKEDEISKQRPKLATNMKAKMKMAPSAIIKTKSQRAPPNNIKKNTKLQLIADTIQAQKTAPGYVADKENLKSENSFITSTQKRTSSNTLTLTNKEFSNVSPVFSPVESLPAKENTINLVENTSAAKTDSSIKTGKAPKKFNFLRLDTNVSLIESPIVRKTPSKTAVFKKKCIETNKTLWPSEVQRTLDAVAQFRQQLADQIERLHALCAKWETYKTENLALLQESAGGEDMIDVTIGQTKLLTSKKFMQFKGLIDRCELGAKGEAPADDGSEATKPITAIDLDGFWSMLDLQVSNLDDRFRTLERWRSNNWTDPDAKVVKKVKKMKKATALNHFATKAKPSAGLQQMLRHIHNEKLKKKLDAPNNSKVESPVCNRSFRSGSDAPNSSQRRISLMVRDRKSRSIAPTVISILTPIRRCSKTPAKQLETCDEPKISPAIKLFKNNMNDFEEMISNLQKTQNESRESPGMYNLRGRAVPLRPSSEIIIPRS